MDYQTYTDDYVKIAGRSALCLLCPTTISTKGMMATDTDTLISHFNANHAMKKGFHYCGTCAKSVCPIIQAGQLEAHIATSRHQVKADRVGKKFRYCEDCLTVNPAPTHNTAHDVVEVEYISLDSTECRGSGGSSVGDMSKEQIASIFCGFITGKKGNLIQARALCNEHFEKTFSNGMGRDPLGIQKGVQAKCVACKKLNAIWPQVPIQPGYIMQLPEEALRRYVVPFFANGLNSRLNLQPKVTVREFAALTDEEQDLYDYNPIEKTFLLKAGYKKSVVGDFLHTGRAAHVKEYPREADVDDQQSGDESDSELNA